MNDKDLEGLIRENEVNWEKEPIEKEYNFEIKWTLYTLVTVKANSLGDAKETILKYSADDFARLYNDKKVAIGDAIIEGMEEI